MDPGVRVEEVSGEAAGVSKGPGGLGSLQKGALETADKVICVSA